MNSSKVVHKQIRGLEIECYESLKDISDSKDGLAPVPLNEWRETVDMYTSPGFPIPNQ